MFEIIPHLFLLGFIFLLWGIFTFVEFNRWKGISIFLLGIFIIFIPIKTFIDMRPINDNKIVTEAQAVQVETLTNGQTKQYIIDHSGNKMWLDPNYWHPDVTYYKEEYKQGTLLWFFNYEDQQFTYFTVENEQTINKN